MATTTTTAHPLHPPGPVEGTGQAFLHTIELCLGPAVFMLVMSFAVFCRKPSQVRACVEMWKPMPSARLPNSKTTLPPFPFPFRRSFR